MNYVFIDDQDECTLYSRLSVLQTDKLLNTKLDRIPTGTLFDRVYEFDVGKVYPGHLHILRYLLHNGYLTTHVLDFSETINKVTQVGGGIAYAMLGVHKTFVHECRRLCIEMDTVASNPERQPFIDRCPYLCELHAYHEKKATVVEPEKYKTSAFSLICDRFTSRDVPNFVYVILICALIKSY